MLLLVQLESDVSWVAVILSSSSCSSSVWGCTRPRKQETTEDYLVASREVSPGSVALSAVATNNSGFMFIG